jgi:chromosome segregation ATPase
LSADDRAKEIQSKEWEEALLSSEQQTERLQEQVARLEKALENSKADCESLQNEMEELKAAFDDASSRDKVEVMEELLATRSREVEELKEEIKNLMDTNSSLSKTLEQNEQQMKVASSAEVASEQLGEAQFEIQSLEGLLEEARRNLSEEREKVDKVRSSLQDKINVVQKELETAEIDLEMTRSKLAEAEERSRRSSSSRMSVEFSPTRSNNALKTTFNHSPLTKFPTNDEDTSPSSEFYRSHALSRRIFVHGSKSRARSCSPTTIQRIESDGEKRTMATATLQNTCDKLENQNRMSVSMKNHLEKEIQQLQKQLLSAKINNDGFSIERRDPASDTLMDNDDRDVEEVLKCDSEVIAKEFRNMAKKVSAQKTHNAELLTRILKLQGNIQVGCRIRPMAVEELQKGCREVAQALTETELGCFNERTRTWHSYAFDKVWGPDARQRDVFQDVEPMALSVVDGYNACIFAYGQVRLLKVS